MPTKLELSYMAGVIDSDGCIGIKKSDYAMRVRMDAGQVVYSERITIKQVEPEAIDLFHKSFGGYRGIVNPSAKRGRPLHCWHIHSRAAGRALKALLPYLRIKRRQAENAIAFRAIIGQGRCWELPPIVDGEPLVTATEFAVLVGASQKSILQACQHGSVPSLKVGRSRMMPVSFAEQYKQRMVNGGHAPRSSRVSEAMEQHYQIAKSLNRVGI